MRIGYCKLAVISCDGPEVSAAFKTGLGAKFPFLSDQGETAINQLDIRRVSKHGNVEAIPYTFSLMPDLTIYNLYNGHWAVGRATVEELRQDLRAIMKKCRSDFDGQKEG